jgi:carboxypeptidase C (cathepsin A)
MQRWFGGIGALPIVLALILLLGTAPASQASGALPDYEAKAGMLEIGIDPERPDAEIFHMDYILKGGDPATRPVTFVFNGGPGGSSIFLHMSALGPKTIKTSGDGTFPAVPARLEDNPESWIVFTDLVFIDPVDTGYSRMLPSADGKPGDPKPYYNTTADVNSMAIFVRKWLTVNNRWASPKAIAGESYGGLRVAALMRILAENYAVNINRAILISPALKVDVDAGNYSILYPMTLLPTQTAIASHHGLNDVKVDEAGMKAVEDYTLNGFLTGLVSIGRSTPEERKIFFDTVARYTGLDPRLVELHNGRIPETLYVGSLLSDRGLILDRYDGTQATDNPTPQEPGLAVLDRSLTVLSGVLLTPFMDYVRNDLGYTSDRPYIPLNFVTNASWDYSGDIGTPDDIGIALAQNPDLKALVVHGYHDLVTNYFLSRYTLEQTTRARGARERLYFGTYPGGHMFYLQSKSRSEFFQDVKGFFAE